MNTRSTYLTFVVITVIDTIALLLPVLFCVSVGTESCFVKPVEEGTEDVFVS